MPIFTTLRHTRRLTGAWLLGVLLALLPLRGWAEVLMHTGGHAAGQSQAADAAAWMPPCHAAMAEEAGAEARGGASGETPPTTESGQACSLCALCHATALCASEATLEASPTVTAAPSSAPAGHGPPALPLPERPPRA
jgi:hypothetical protein